MNSEVYDALLSAGANETKARTLAMTTPAIHPHPEPIAP